MAAAAATPALHKIVKEAVEIGVRLNSLYKAFKDQLQPSVDDVQTGVSRLQVGDSQARRDAGNLRADIKVIKQENLKACDNQASLLALFSKGSSWTCGGRLDALLSEISKGFDSVFQTVEDKDAVRDARDFKSKLNHVAITCNHMMEGIVAVAESQQRRFSACTGKDIEKAQSAASELYQWANSFVPDSSRALTKQSKLQMMPYIVAMAFAARIQILTYILERDTADAECDKVTYLKRARTVLDDFTAALTRALEGVMADTSLLQIAMDYQLPMAMYLTLMTSFRASVEELLQSPGAERKEEVVVWDDGLTPIRDVILYNASDADLHDQVHTVEFKNLAEGMWWLTFTDTSFESVDIRTMRTSVHIYDICHVLGAADDEQSAHIALNPAHRSALLQLPPASQLRTALCATIAHARLAPPPSFARISKPPPPGQAMRSAAFAPACLQAAAPRTLSGHSYTVSGVAVCPDGEHIVSGCIDGTLRLWSLSSGQHLRSLSGHTDEINCVAITPDGKRAVSGSADKSVRVWSIDSGRAQHTLQGHSHSVLAVAVSPDGLTIASSSDDTVKLWNAESGKCQGTLKGKSGGVRCMAFSLDGKTLFSGSANTAIQVWNTRTGALWRSLHGHSDSVRGVAVTSDGQRVVSGDVGGTMMVWSQSSEAEDMRFEGHSGGVTCVAVFPNGLRIASGSRDCSVRVWNLRSRALEVTLTGHSRVVESVAVSPDGRSVVSGSEDRTIKVWVLSGGGGSGRAM